MEHKEEAIETSMFYEVPFSFVGKIVFGRNWFMKIISGISFTLCFFVYIFSL